MPSGRTCSSRRSSCSRSAACAWYFGPFGPTGRPDPTIIQTVPKPDYFFLWLYALLSLLPPSLETPALLIGPVVAIVALLLLPFLSGEGEKSWKRRPIAVLTVMLIAITLGTFTHLAGYAPWSPHMNAWSGDPVPEQLLRGTTALQRQGALVFQAKQCRNCHALGDSGGERGPASRQRGRAAHAGSAHSTGDSRRRQHARVREEPESGRDDGAGRVSRDAASAKSTAGARGCTRCCARLRRGYARERDEMILVFVFLALGYMRGWLRSRAEFRAGGWRVARGRFSSRPRVDLDCSCLAVCIGRCALADGSHGPASDADVACASLDLAG